MSSDAMRIALQVIAFALLVAACGAARESSPGAEPTTVSVPPEKLTTQIVGASPKQEEILLASLSGLGDRRIEKITVEEAEPGWGESDGGVALSFEPRPNAADDMRFSWEAFLIGDAFAERSAELKLPQVSYVSIPGETSALGELGYDPSRRTIDAVNAFVARLEEESQRADAKVREIEVLKPLGYAVAVTLEVPDPANFLDHRARDFFQRLGEPPADFDLRFVDSNGARVSENWHAGSGGSVWIRQDLDGCSPYREPPDLVQAATLSLGLSYVSNRVSPAARIASSDERKA